MPFIKYQNTNNANSVLIAWISAISTTILIKDWDQNLFPSEFPFLLTLEHKDWNWNVILREIVKAISQNQNTYIVERWAWMCVQDDTASNRIQDNTTHAFESWDSVSLYRTSEQVKDIQDKLELSVNDPAIADEYDSTETYAVWDTVMYEWDRYQCTVAVETAEDFDSTKRTKISVQYELKQAQEDIVELQNRKTASDHLEESWLVWELYTLNDKLFKQYTPTLANSTVDCNVWDVANNTEIHIQRIWSWIASNELKLKVKSVWSPTTWLVVEVRKWVEVDVSTSEAYRYWNEVIASWSIWYSSISNSYAEFTVSLNENFWWTEWELLDVVVYQTWSIVNASNYYVIACDNTQYSEAFSYVSVNGSTRTRSKSMPYAISDWFAQSLLCKVIQIINFVNNPNWTKTVVNNPNIQYESLWYTTKAWRIRITTSSRVSAWSWSLYVWLWTQYKNTSPWTNKTTYTFISDSVMPAWSNVQIWIKWTSSNTIYAEWAFVDIIPTDATSNYVPLFPTSIKWIWQKWTWILYWKLNDNFIWWLMTDKSSSVTTWNIILWPAVWYITVNLNGEIVKIPYYNN